MLTVILVCFNFHYASTVTSYNCLHPALGMLALLITENIVVKTTPVRLKALMVLKYLYICMVVTFVILADNIYAFGMGILCVLLYDVEFYFTLDFSESFVRKVYLILIWCPVICGAIAIALLNRTMDWMSNFEMVCILIL